MIEQITAVGYIRLLFLATQNFKTPHSATTLLLAFQNDITDKLSIGYNFGTAYDGENTINTWIATASVGFAASGRLSFFEEYFSEFDSENKPYHNIDLGALWLLNNNLQIDIALGLTIFQHDKNKFITTEISYRFRK